MSSAGLVLAGTFGVFAVVASNGSMGPNVEDIGVALALGILLDTFVVRTLMVPSVAVLLGRWNWWPSRLGARLEEGTVRRTHSAASAQSTGK